MGGGSRGRHGRRAAQSKSGSRLCQDGRLKFDGNFAQFLQRTKEREELNDETKSEKWLASNPRYLCTHSTHANTVDGECSYLAPEPSCL